MTRQNALSVTLAVGNGGMPETFTALGGMVVSRLVVGRRIVAAAHLGDEGWRSLISGAGMRSLSITGSGEFTNSTAEETLRVLAFSGDAAHWRIDFGAGGIVTVPCIVSAYERLSAAADIVRYQVGLESAAEATYIAP